MTAPRTQVSASAAVAGALALTCLLPLAGCSSSHAPATLPYPLPATVPPATAPVDDTAPLTVGTPATVTGRADDGTPVTQTVTVGVVQVTRHPSSQAIGATQPPRNGYYVVARVSVRETDGRAQFNALDWSLQDPSGTTYTEAAGNTVYSGFGAAGDWLNVATLRPGQRVAGVVVFDSRARHGTLWYGPGGFSGADRSTGWRF